MSEEEFELSEGEDESDCEYAYGLCMPKLPEGLQPLECVVLIEGIMMDSGQPTITAMGSEGMKPWVAVGMLRMEASRLELSYSQLGSDDDFGDEDEEEDDDY